MSKLVYPDDTNRHHPSVRDTAKKLKQVHAYEQMRREERQEREESEECSPVTDVDKKLGFFTAGGKITHCFAQFSVLHCLQLYIISGVSKHARSREWC